MARRIEVMIRSRSQVPPDYEMAVSEPIQSDVAGYVQVVVTFTTNGNTSKPLPFLVSTDGKTLAQFSKFDLSQDPRDKVSATGRPARGGPPSAHAGEMAGTEKTQAKADQNLDKFALDEGVRQKVNSADLAACVQKQDDSRVKASLKDAEAEPLDLNSTPILFINGEKVEGVVSTETLFRIIDEALIAAGQTPPPPPAPQQAPAAAKPGS